MTSFILLLTMFHVLYLHFFYSITFYYQLSKINKQGKTDHAVVIIDINEYLLLLLTRILHAAFDIHIHKDICYTSDSSILLFFRGAIYLFFFLPSPRHTKLHETH